MNFSFHSLKTLTAIGALAALVHAGDYSTWTSYRPVTLSTSGMGLSAAVANYPVSVRFKASAHKDMLDSTTQVQANGSDIRVTLADGTTDVPFEIEHLSTGANGRLHLWILAANVPASNANAATFRVYWGKTGQTSMSNPSATFPTSAGYQAVFHLNDTGATIVNSANNGLNGTATGTSTTTGQNAAQGYVSAKSGFNVRAFGTSNGGEDNATPIENYIKFSPTAGHILSTHTGPITMEGWIYSSISNSGNTSQGTKHIIAHGTGNTGGNAWFARTASLDGTGGQNHYSAGGPNNISGPIAPFAEQHFWQYAVASWNGTSWTIFRQRETDPWNNPSVTGPTGMTPDSATYKTIQGNAPTASTNPWYIGGAGDDAAGTTVSRGFHGWMDEVRISTVARDSNYVKLNFLTTRTDSMAGIIHPVAIGATESPAAVGSYGAWSNRRSIILNTTTTGANVATTVTNFPVLIRLGNAEAAIIAAAKADGSDIRFSKADNTTPLPYQIESWTPTSAAIWVRVDSVKGNNATQHIRMHWGNAAATSQSSGDSVFTSANGYVAVFHMGGTNNTNPRPNSVAGGTAATPANLTTDAVKTGMIGLADSLGTNGEHEAGSHLSFGPVPVGTITTGKATLSAWIKKTAFGTQWRHAISIGSGAPNNNFWFGTTGSEAGALRVRTAQGTTEQTAINAPGAWVDETWQHVQVAYEPTGTNSVVYVNGASVATGDIGHILGDVERTLAYIGRAPWPDGKFTGVFDEVRFQKTTRSAGWVKLEYENQKAVNSLVNIGIPVFTVPGQPTAVVATADTAAANVSWTAPADNGGKPILSYKATVVGDTLLTCTSATLTCKITDLPLGAPINIVVRAINEVGHGPNSLASNAVTPISPVAPSAPRNPVAVVNSSSAVTVSWMRPLATGGVAISGYTVTATATGTAGGTCTTADTTCQVTGLNQGTTYSFTVVATNAAGNSPASTAITAMTTSILPGAFVIAMNGSHNPYTYRLPAASVGVTERLTMTISDVQGKRIWTRTINPAATKINELTWNGTTSKGQAVAPGLYVVHLKAVMDGQVIEAIQKGVRQ